MYYAVHPDPDGREPAHTANYPADAPVWDHTSYTTQTQQMGLTRRIFIRPASTRRFRPTKAAGNAASSCRRNVLPSSWRDAKPPVDARRAWMAMRGRPSSSYAGNIQVWELRGAIAAGMSVFSYLEQRVSDPTMAKLSPYYDQCELLP